MTATTDDSFIDLCNASDDYDYDTERIRRSINYVLENTTTTEIPSDTTADLSILSPEFRNCSAHIYIEPECYEKFDNDSVYVPQYNMMFNKSNYFINRRILFVCPTFHDILFDDKLISKSAATNSSIVDHCNASANYDYDTERILTSINYASENATTTETPSETTIDLSILSAEFLNCSQMHIYLEPECYKKLQNESVYVPRYNMLFDRSNYLIREELLFICSDIFDKAIEGKFESKFSDHFQLVSLVCSCISTICISLHIIMFIIVKQLRNLPGCCLLSLCIALIGAYICVFIQDNKEAGVTQCAVLGMSMMYFFLAAFFWMNVMAYDVWKSIRMATSKLRLSTNRSFIIQYSRYSIFAWGTPLMIIIISIIIHYSVSEDSKYRLKFNENTCWFKYKSALSLYFVGPLFILLSLNILFFVSSFFMISKASMSKSQSKNNKGSSDLWSRLFLSLRLGSVMGFMWIFGFLAVVTKQQWLWFLYAACSALQGVFIFFSFTISERTRKSCMKLRLKRNFSVMPTQMTSQHGSSMEQNASSV